jgi:2-aminobenzoate-CoA ligase
MLDVSAYSDTFARDHLPPVEFWPEINQKALDAFGYPKRMNAAVELLDAAVLHGFGARPCLRTMAEVWTYDELLAHTNRIASVLVDDFGLVPGNRVLLRAPNSPIMAACWLAVLKAGGVAVATMPLLRARELSHIIAKAKIDFALCDARLADELQAVTASSLKTLYFNTEDADGLEARAASKSDAFANVMVSHDDVALIAFTSGTTGVAKGTLHFHRDVLAICDTWHPVLRTTPNDVFAGSAPFAFTFGLGALLLFPLRHGASSVLLEHTSAEGLIGAIQSHHVSTLFTVPTLYRSMACLATDTSMPSLKKCVSSGEHLPVSVFEGWQAATGHRIVNSIGSTEMLHAFLAMPPEAARAGPVGLPLPGYQAAVVDEDMRPVLAGTVGRLVIRGPTGCRYLGDDDRQRNYVRDGWNLTGDAFLQDKDGLFWYHARTDDMIVSAGYNISGAEVEEVLLDHPAVRECAVVGIPDAERGQVVKAFIVLADGVAVGEAVTKSLQERVRNTIAPYKYPRAIEYCESLPRTVSGKIQRNILRDG